MEQARSEITTIAARLEKQFPEANTGATVNLVPFPEQVLGKTVPTMLLVLLGAVVFVLLIACVNVANLLLARGANRDREVAVRTAMGAGRTRLIRQMLTESMVLAVVAAALGLALAAWALRVLMLQAPPDIPRLDQVSLDGPVLAFTVLISVLAGILFGLTPAVKISRGGVNESLAVNNRTAPGGKGARKLRSALVVAEIGLAVILLTGAGLLIRSFVAVLAVDPGFQAERTLTLRFNLRDPSFVQQALERIRALPGVQAVGTINGIIFSGAVGNDARVFTATGGDAFRALGIPLVKGRFFNEGDEQADAPLVAMVNETMARRSWPGEDPIGKRIPFRDQGMTVIGVVRDTRNAGLESQPIAQVFPAPQARFKGGAIIVVRAAGDPLALVPSIQGMVRSMDKRAALWSVSTFNQQLAAQTARRRFQSFLLGLFSLTALALAGVGIFGVLHYSVAQRTQEIGVRMALGARAGDVVGMVVREGMTLAMIGVAVGMAGAFWLTRLLSTQLFGVTPTDPATFASVAVVLTAVALAACYVPARRATQIDPMEALRYE